MQLCIYIVYIFINKSKRNMSTSANNNSNNGVALDLSRKRKKKRILIVRKSNSNDAGEQTNPTFPQTNDSTASLRSTGAGIQYGSPTRSVKRKEIVLARNVNAESLRSLGPTSPVQIRKEEGPRVDPKTKRISSIPAFLEQRNMSECNLQANDMQKLVHHALSSSLRLPVIH